MNTVKRKQRGMSITTWIFIIAIVLFFTLLGIKMIPSYLEFYSIQSVLESIKEDRSMQKATPKEIRKIFNRRIDINGVYDFDQKSLKITKAKKGKMTMEIDYEIRKEMAGNVDVVMSFYKQVEM